MQKITPFLWFENEAEEAMKFYVSLFDDAEIVSEQRLPDGSLMTGTVGLAGQTLMVLNGRPDSERFTEAFSLFVSCEDQAEVDRLWAALTADGGAESMCGWLKDKFGLSWQIVPTEMMEMFGAPDRDAANRAMQAMLKMRKLEIVELRRAFEG
jgi:predicted 3-demethylubiquinone-9 3-methyltransferase (glyoxalase superfamily)